MNIITVAFYPQMLIFLIDGFLWVNCIYRNINASYGKYLTQVQLTYNHIRISLKLNIAPELILNSNTFSIFIHTVAVLFVQSNCIDRIFICDIQSLTLYRLAYDIYSVFLYSFIYEINKQYKFAEILWLWLEVTKRLFLP